MSENTSGVIAQVEEGLNIAGAVATAAGVPEAGAAVAALDGAEAVTAEVQQAIDTHTTALATAAGALSTAIAVAPTVAAAVSPAAAVAVTAATTKATGLLAEIESILAMFGIKL